jgi:hypothetical protein
MNTAGGVKQIGARDIFFHIRLVGRQWDRDLLQLAFLSGGGDVVISTFAWSPVADVQTERMVGPSILKILGPITPSVGFMTPLIHQVCLGANLIAMDIDRQRRLAPAGCLTAARSITALPADLAPLVQEGVPSGEVLSEAIDRAQDAVTVTFRLLYLWSGSRPQGRHLPMPHERWEGLQVCGR